MSNLTIRFVTDYVCPYCIAAKIPLMRAAKKRGIPIEWMPFELTTTDKPAVDTWNDPVRREKWAATLVPFCEKQGMSFHFPPHVIPRPYTNLAFMGWYYACEHGKGEEYNSRMYELYFAEEKNIGDIKVLSAEAASLGMDAADFEQAVLSGRYSEKLAEANRYARQELGVTHVPTVWIGETRVLNALMSEEEYGELIDQLLAGDDASQQENEGGFGCGPDGCNFPGGAEDAAPSGCGPDGCR